ncbi:MAG: hypothetical protein Q9223_004112 [Gallowayella weberi]
MACLQLPSEIRLHILESCPDLATAVTLARSSKAFLGTWKAYKEDIARGILKKTIECYDAAEELFNTVHTTAPESFEEDKSHLDLEYYTSCILAGAKAAKRACITIQCFPSLFGRHGEQTTVGGMVPLNQIEHRRCIYVYYKVHTLSAIPDYSSTNHSWLEKSLRTISQRNFIIIAVVRTLGLTDENVWGGHPGRDSDLIQRVWRNVFHHLAMFLSLRDGINQYSTEIWKIRRLRYGLWVLLDDYQHMLDDYSWVLPHSVPVTHSAG